MASQLKLFSCISCRSSFKRNSSLLSHLAQAKKCHWVLQQCKAIEAAEIHDYRDLSDGEDDPPGDMDCAMDYDRLDAMADEIMGNVEPEIAVVPNLDNRRAYVEDVPDIDDPPDEAQRGQAEDELDHDYICYREFTGAGKVSRIDGEIHKAFSASGQGGSNIYHPFVSRLDWELGQWANEDGPSEAALNRLLDINGVRFESILLHF